MFINLIGDLEINSPQLRTQIRLFLKKLKDRDYTKKAIARKIASLRSFFKFLTVNEYITIKNPMVNIKTPKIKIEENLPKFLDLADIEKLLIETTDNRKFNSKKSKRYYLIIRLLYSTMARVSELCNIKITDIDFDTGYVRLRGKGNKERIVPVDEKTIVIIEEYLRNRISYDPDDYLIVNTRMQKLSPRVVQDDIKNIKAMCGFPASKIITPHVFRHTGATHLRRSGNDPTKLKKSYDLMHPLNTKNM